MTVFIDGAHNRRSVAHNHRLAGMR